jgi:hypothetical protein
MSVHSLSDVAREDTIARDLQELYLMNEKMQLRELVSIAYFGDGKYQVFGGRTLSSQRMAGALLELAIEAVTKKDE